VAPSVSRSDAWAGAVTEVCSWRSSGVSVGCKTGGNRPQNGQARPTGRSRAQTQQGELVFWRQGQANSSSCPTTPLLKTTHGPLVAGCSQTPPSAG
jgi:hypothetical protein